MDRETLIWQYLQSRLNNPYGTAGLMGNLYAESALNPQNLQNSFEKSLGYTDQEYTKAVNNGTYNNNSSNSEDLSDFANKKKEQKEDVGG